ncbi:MAG: hypothetical protein L0154_18570 [Chloroflexi bacterium]|nr:hypothetical protein [Chloroflexota bacterium]
MFEPDELFPSLTDKVEMEWLGNGGIVLFAFADLSDETTEEWFEIATNAFANWPPLQPICMLLDFSRLNAIIIRSGFRQRAQDLSRQQSSKRARVAVVLPQDQALHLGPVRLLLRSLYNSSTVERKIFFNRQEAINWLAEVA